MSTSCFSHGRYESVRSEKDPHAVVFWRQPVFSRLNSNSFLFERIPLQTAGVEWLAFNYSERRSSILADEMGLGKTAQTICFLDYLGRRQPGAIALVVVPLSVLVNW